MVFQQQEALTVMKGKRTKRPRAVLSPLTLADDGGPQGAENSSDTSSVEWASPAPDNTEEEDMAHCLILLAQGSKPNNDVNDDDDNNNNSNNNNNNNNKGATSYECKTCNRSFPSFQALGGHRASHKKPKLSIAVDPDHQTKKSSVFFSLLHDNHHQHHPYDGQFNEEEIALSLQLANGATSNAIHNHNNNSNNNNSNSNSNNKVKVHECSVCGAEFSSGQALGGHMRRHRPIGGTHTTTTTSIPSPSQSLSHNMSMSMSMSITNGSPNNNISSRSDQEKTRNLLSLDLNLPAPEDEHGQHRDSKFVFPSNEKTLVFSATSLVDCHY